jgi:hypothetical protein
MAIPMTPAPSNGGPGAVPLAAPRAKIRPGRIWYLVGLVVFLGGVVWLVVGLASVFSHVDSFARVAIPAGGQVSLDHSGGYVIYYEGPGAQSGQIPPFQVRVTPASAGAAVRSLAPYGGSLTYSNGSHEGSAVLTLQVTHPGRFTVETPGAANLPAGSDLAFGDSFGGGLVASIVGGVLLILAGLAVLIVIFVIRLVKTNRVKSAAAAQQPGSGWSPPGAGWSPPGAQPPPGPEPPPSAQPPPGAPPPGAQL